MLNLFKIDTEEVSAGNFTHRCRCPFSQHKSGTEKTKSLYIDSINNNFYCFGCNASNNVVDFYMIYKNISFVDAIEDLSKYICANLSVDAGEDVVYSQEVKLSNFPILLEISKIIRDLYQNPLTNAEFIYLLDVQITPKIIELDDKDYDGAKKLLNKLNNYLDKIGVKK